MKKAPPYIGQSNLFKGNPVPRSLNETLTNVISSSEKVSQEGKRESKWSLQNARNLTCYAFDRVLTSILSRGIKIPNNIINKLDDQTTLKQWSKMASEN